MTVLRSSVAALLVVALGVPLVPVASAHPVGRPGGLNDPRPANDHVQELCNSVREQAQEKLQASGWNGVFTDFNAKIFASQVVAGTMYFVKVDTGSGHFVHLKIYEPLPFMNEDASLSGVKTASEDDPIDFF
mmetsp:Transcript_1283/g.3661  ORF Transcript_1283/g.3661 Transcript_1283/m.3661 type:complete len:132 (+) Transcript_1283:84-479(+)